MLYLGFCVQIFNCMPETRRAVTPYKVVYQTTEIVWGVKPISRAGIIMKPCQLVYIIIILEPSIPLLSGLVKQEVNVLSLLLIKIQGAALLTMNNEDS